MTSPLQIEVDTELSVGYVTFALGNVARTVSVGEGVNLDLDSEGTVLGLELLDLSANLPQDTLINDYQLDPTFIAKLSSDFF